MNRLLGVLLFISSLVLFLVALATLAAMFNALVVEDTLAAAESAFGSLVIAVACFVLGRLALRAAMLRLRREKYPQG